MATLQQSHGEITRVFIDWKNFHAPKNLIDDEQTASLLVDYIVQNYGGNVSFTALNAAVAALGNQVLTPEPTPAEKAAADAVKAEARMRRDYLDSKKPQGFDHAAAEKEKAQATVVKKAQQEAEIKRIESRITSEINEYLATTPYGVDYSQTESNREKLRRVRDQHNRRTLEGVQQAYAEVKAAKSKL
jgi:hypothetical protein